MAIKHRKLFPTSQTNQTTDCADPYVCDPDYSYSFPPLQPPPTATTTHHHRHLSPYLIAIVTLLSSVFLILSSYCVVVKLCTRLRRPNARRNVQDEEILDQEAWPTVDHPIWYITTVGLQPSVISSITVVKFAKAENLIEGTDCSVCLNEFREGETLRLLPKCNHAFHIPCIDTWLRSHTNCPLCRAGILSNTLSAALAANDRNSSSLRSNGNTQMGNLESGNGTQSNRVTEDGIPENREETGDCSEISISSNTLSASFASADPNLTSLVSENSDNDCKLDADPVLEGETGENSRDTGDWIV